MLRILANLFVVVGIIAAALAYVFYGPPENTRAVMESSFYKYYLLPVYDDIQLRLGRVPVGRVISSAATLTIRSTQDASPHSPSDGERLSGAYLINNGARGVGIFELDDGSKISFAPNTSAVLKPRGSADQKSYEIEVRIVEGDVLLERSFSPKYRVNMVSPKGVAKSGIESKIGFFSPRMVTVKNTEDATLELGTQIDEFFEASEKVDFVNTPKRKIAEFETKIRERQNDINVAAEREENHRAQVFHDFELAQKKHQADSARRRIASLTGIEKTKFVESEKLSEKVKSFFASTKITVEELLKTYIRSGDCRQALALLEGTAEENGPHPSITQWAESWKLRLRSECK